MEISSDSIDLIRSKFYSVVGYSDLIRYPIEQVDEAIQVYFDNGSLSPFKELNSIMTNFNRKDNPLLKSVDEKDPAGLGWISKNIKAFFSEMFPSVWQGFTKNINEGIEEYTDVWLQKIIGFDDKKISSFLSKFVKMGFLSQESMDNLIDSYSEIGKVNPLIYLFIIGSLLMNLLQIMGGTVGGDYIKNMNSLYTPAVPPAESLIQGLRTAPELKDEFIKAFKENGLSDNDIKLMLISNYALYDIDTIRQLYLRGEISKDKMIERLSELGFTPERISEIIKLWDIIPSAQDLLWMVGKEAFEPDTISLLGLNNEFPEEQSKWLSKQGLSRYWQEKYWVAHWQVPGIQQGFEMYHRGVINDKELDIMFRTVEIPPYWREKLKQIAFNPYTRVDIRRMHLLGTVSTKEVYQNYLDLGYNAEKAEKMTAWTIDYNQGTERSITKEQISKAYRDKIINKNDAIQWLLNIGLSETSANFSIDYVDYELEKEYQDNIVDIVKDSFSNNLMSESEARSRLTNIDIESSKIDYLIEKWKIRTIANRKLPSKTDLEKMYKSEIITIDQYKYQLKIIGYEDKYIKWYASLIRGKKGV